MHRLKNKLSGDRLFSWLFGLLGLLLFARLILMSIKFANAHDGQINWFRVIINLVIIGGVFAFAVLLHNSGKKHLLAGDKDITDPMWKRMAPVWALLVLAPWVGEFLLGNVPATSLPALPVLIPLYGGGALLIREVARRTGHGWPTMLLLAAAYGLIEAGLVDQSLFNSSFEGQVLGSDTLIPALGIDVNTAIAYISGHTIWSIAIPIAIVEALTPRRRTTPWLGKIGTGLTGCLYIIGCIIVYTTMLNSEGFTASTEQRIGTTLVAVCLIALAFIVGEKRQHTPTSSSKRVPRPRRLAILTLIVGLVFFVRPENWFGVGLSIVLLVAAAVAIARWSRQKDWTIRHQFALVVGALPIYMGAGFVLTGMLRPGDIAAWIGNVVFAVIAAILLTKTAQRLRQTN